MHFFLDNRPFAMPRFSTLIGRNSNSFFESARMHIPKSSQKTLFDVEVWMPEGKQRRMEESWAQAFRDEVLPLLIAQEASFARFYSPDHGAPNEPVAGMLALAILQAMRDLTDDEVADQFEWNVQWHYALDEPMSTSHVCTKTLYNFRRKLLRDSAASELFASMTDAMLARFSLATGRHRIDSTHVVSNMRSLARVGLFVRAIEALLRALKKHDPAQAEKLPKRFAERYGKKRGYFADVRGSKAERRLAECAEDLYYLLDHFRGDEGVTALRAYAVAKRLFAEQCDVAAPAQGASEPTVTVKAPADIASDSLQSISDTDATYSGHKGKGYSVQLAETCHPDNAFQLIDHVSVTGAHESDQTAAARIHDDLLARGHELEETFAAAGYVSGENILAAEARGIDLIGPMSGGAGPADPDAVTLAEFTYAPDRRTIERCPAGHAPIAHKESRSDNTTIAYFDAAVCAACPLAERCPTTPRRRARSIRFAPAAVAIAQRRRALASDAFWEAYAIRSGIEPTNGHLKRDHGLGRLRVRGQPAVTLAATLRVLAENCHRVVRHVLDTAADAVQQALKAAHLACEAAA